MNAAILARMQNKLRNNDSENDSENELENNATADSTADSSEKHYIENESENDSQNDIQNDSQNSDEVEVKVSQNDPLDQFKVTPEEQVIDNTPPKTTVEETVKAATGDSARNMKNLSDLGMMVLDMFDDAKAMLCGAIASKHPAEFAGDQKQKEALLEAAKEYLSSKEVSAPSPFWTLMIAIAVWAGPSLGIAVYTRMQNEKERRKKEAEAPAKLEYLPQMQVVRDEPSEAPEEKAEPKVSKYAHTKEFKDNRRKFDIHKTKGCYNSLPEGGFCKISLANEMPSAEIQELIDEGKTNQEIREIIYGE